MGQNRIIGFDYLRVFSSFSVVCIHSFFANKTLSELNIYNSYAVPAFIMMSMFLVSAKKENKFNILKLFKRLFPQYAFWTMLYLSLRIIKAKVTGESFSIDFSILLLGGSAVQLWFLPALFFWQISVFSLPNYKNIFLDVSIAILLFILGRYLMVEGYLGVGFPNAFAIFSGYIFVAKVIYQYREKMEKIPTQLLLIVLFIIAITKFYSQLYIWDVLYSVIIFLLFLNISFRKSRIIESFSYHSYGIYLAHFLFIQIFIFVCKTANVELNISMTLFNILLSYFLSYGLSRVLSINKWTRRLI